MAGIKLQIGNDIFIYPENGSGNWGEEATAWAEAVTKALETVQGPNDILITEALLSDGGSGIISGLNFNVGQVLGVEGDAVIERTYADATPKETEYVKFTGSYNGTTFTTTPVFSGDDTGVEIDVDNTGQYLYVAESKPNTLSLTIKFRAKTIDQ